MENKNERAAKRVKLEIDQSANTPAQIEAPDTKISSKAAQHRYAKRQTHAKPPAERSPSRKVTHCRKGNNKHHNHSNAKPEKERTFSQPSAICTGDKGVFVTCDKGKEKKCLLELHDLVEQCLEEARIGANGKAVDDAPPKEVVVGAAHPSEPLDENGIELDIEAELAEMRGGNGDQAQQPKSRPMQLITLDIPCVSLLRFPPGSTINPTNLVHKLCSEATNSSSPQQSRYIKRLTPICTLAKTLKDGLEKVCDDILPQFFGPDTAGGVKGVSFVIRPTIRNNDKLDRDSVIEMVADKVQMLGQQQHRVDLKHYELGVLVEVYRGWVGMSVVDNRNGAPNEKGFEQLKRFNLAEIYAGR